MIARAKIGASGFGYIISIKKDTQSFFACGCP